MKKICWITPDYFIDVDLPIIKLFKNEDNFEINWFVIFTNTNVSTFNSSTFINNNFIHTNLIYLKNRIRSINTLSEFIKLIFKLKKEEPELIYVSLESEPYFIFLLKFFFGSKKIIYAIHDVEPHVGVSKFFHFLLWIKIKLFKNFHLFSLSQKEIFLRKYEDCSKNIFFVPLFLKSFGVSNNMPPEDKIVFLFFGKIVKNKGLEYLIEAANKLALTHFGKFEIKIAGKCENWTPYAQIIKVLEAFDLEIEAIPNEKIADLFCKAHYLVLPYKDVTQSGPLMLAYNYKIPVIASSLPGFSEYIEDGVNGYLFETENVDSLYAVMEKIINEHQNKYEYIQNSLIEYVNCRFKKDVIIDKYKNMFDTVLTS